MLVLTVVTGLVDAVSYLKLGHVFVANMTGNFVFLGFAIAGAHGLSAPASLFAIGLFLVGGFVGGRLGAAVADDRGRLLQLTSGIQIALVTAAVVVAALAHRNVQTAPQYVLIVLLATAMGIQNATARRLAVPDLTTTVLTLTLTGIAADSALAGGVGARVGRRLLAIVAMVLGALFGALLLLRVANLVPVAVADALLAFVALTASRAEPRPRPAVTG